MISYLFVLAVVVIILNIMVLILEPSVYSLSVTSSQLEDIVVFSVVLLMRLFLCILFLIIVIIITSKTSIINSIRVLDAY